MKKYILVLSTLLPLYALADEPSCGENCTYTYVENGIDNNNNPTYTLIIEPIDNTKSASISSYGRYGYDDSNFAPWRFENITNVEIKEGIETIGGHAFEDMHKVTSVSLPEGLKTIGYEAFHGSAISSIHLPDSLENIMDFGLGVASLTEITGTPNLTEMWSNAFSGVHVENFVVPTSVSSVNFYAFGDTSADWNTSTIKNIYCTENIAEQCLLAAKRHNENAEVKTYELKDGVYALNGVYYLSGDDMKNGDSAENAEQQALFSCGSLDVCKAKVLNNKGICSDLTGDCKSLVDAANDGKMLKVGSKTYQSINDLLKGNYDKRRIYTIEEANFVAGPVNTIRIKYR
ncbi:MAG: leucine-rich repeat domain-containing protein [Alphaproteobacteria bacterium]|nr:leucine-rich repeat domain-containing protein [Alphaproteobacteria bacterium]